jgi:hypothetical protein
MRPATVSPAITATTTAMAMWLNRTRGFGCERIDPPRSSRDSRWKQSLME